MDLATLALREFAADLPTQPGKDAERHSPVPAGSTTTRTTLRRCRTREQGIALLMVGHAIEYLVQSRLIEQQTTSGAEREALAILLNANLSLYNDGTEIVSLVTRLRRWFHGDRPLNPNAAAVR